MVYRNVCGLNIIVFFVTDRAEGVPEHNSPYWDLPPYFDNSSRREYVTTVGQTAYLHCRVRNLGDRAVSTNIKALIYIWNLILMRT